MKPFFKDPLTTIYNEDAEKILPKLKPRELLLTDPPYGLGKKWNRSFHGSNGKTRLWGKTPEWDANTISKEFLHTVREAGTKQMIWGGNFYELPPAKCWFVWYKAQTGFGADCELAWTNLDIAPKVFKMSRLDAYHNKSLFKKVHPTEKPIQLGLYILRTLKPESIIDPFMGTGSFILAARLLGIPSVGIEINEKYCIEALLRIQNPKVKHLTESKVSFGL